MANIFEQYQNKVIDAKTQQKLNQPLKDENVLTPDMQKYLDSLLDLINKGQLDILNAQSLYNRAVYDKLSEEDREKADLTAVNLMSVISQIQKLWSQNPVGTYQIKNLVETVFQMKSRFEEKYGDVYII